MTYFLDTNIFLRLLVREDEQLFFDCYELFSFIKDKKIKAFTSSHVLAEINWVLKTTYHFPKKDIVRSIKTIVQSISLLDEIDFSFAIKLYEEHKAKFIDCLIASSKKLQKGDMAIISYDKDFDKLGVKRIVPGDVV